MDLKTEDIGLLELASFRENDQSYSPNIFGVAQPGDLCIRDLGYSVCKVFDAMNKKSIHFISRLQYGIKVYDIKGNRINLTSYLRKSFRNGAKKIDRQVLISAEKIPVRLVVFKRSEQEYQLKRQQRIKDRHTNTAHDKDYYERLRYCIYIANVGTDIAPAETIRSLYRLRWRIEIFFKCWKGQLHLDKIFKNISTPNPAVNKMLIYLILLKVVLYHQEIIQKMMYHLNDLVQTTPGVSILKIYKIFSKYGDKLARCEDSEFIHKFLSYFATYSKDKNRKTHYEIVYTLNFNSS